MAKFNTILDDTNSTGILATTASETIKADINVRVNENLNHSLFVQKDRVLKVFELKNKKITFAVDENYRVRILLEQEGKQSAVKREDIEGIPQECFADASKMKDFLSNSYANVVEYLDKKGFKLKVNLKLAGGGNIGSDINKWPVIYQADGYPRVVVPYRFIVSDEARNLWNSGIRTSTNSTLSRELSSIYNILVAIKRWNETGLTNILRTSDYEQEYGSPPDRWIAFDTNTPDLCIAPCIGMCPQQGEHIVTCDLTGKFKSNPVQSIMHEIGHVLGLRHEHAREDCGNYVNTNFEKEHGSTAVGKYDFDSLMHYELGKYNQGLFLYKRINRKYEEHYIQTIGDDKVGKNPVVSDGDKKSVMALYKNEKPLNLTKNNGYSCNIL